MSHTRDHKEGLTPEVSEAVCHGTVLEVKGETVLIELDDNQQCNACASKGSCSFESQAGKQLEVAARGFVKGEHVEVHSAPGAMLKVSVVLYLIPVLLVITGAFAGAVAIPEFLGWSMDVGSMVGVVSGIVASLLFVHFYRTGQAGNSPQLWLEKVEDDG